MPWSAKVLSQFQAVPPNPDESEFHGAYNKLLNIIFPPDTDFTVVPQYLKPASLNSSDYIFTFEILLENRPVLILELNKPADIRDMSSRAKADEHIRKRMRDLARYCPIPTLHAVSAMGTRLCFYRLETTDAASQIIPPRNRRHSTLANDTAPAKRWDCDVLDTEGVERLYSVKDEIGDEYWNIPNA